MRAVNTWYLLGTAGLAMMGLVIVIEQTARGYDGCRAPRRSRHERERNGHDHGSRPRCWVEPEVLECIDGRGSARRHVQIALVRAVASN